MSIDTSSCFPMLATAPRWLDRGAPCPSIEENGYEIDAGLVRTTWENGRSRQRRKYLTRPTTFKLSWMVNQAGLRKLEQTAMSIGYDWFYLPLVSGQVSKFYSIDHPVRFISNLQVTLSSKARRSISGGFSKQDAVWTVTVEAEQFDFNNNCMEGKLPAA